MTPDRFQEMIDAFGADPNHWPPAEREAALGLLARSSDARAAVAAARRLDGLLDQAPAPTGLSFDAAVLAARIAATPQRSVVSGRTSDGGGWRLSFGWFNVAGLAAAAIAGFIVGATNLDGSFGIVALADGVDILSSLTVEETLW
jgi:hypothetical protein